MAKPIPIRSEDGKHLHGSIGTGKDNLPTPGALPVDIPTTSETPFPEFEQVTDINAVYDRFEFALTSPEDLVVTEDGITHKHFESTSFEDFPEPLRPNTCAKCNSGPVHGMCWSKELNAYHHYQAPTQEEIKDRMYARARWNKLKEARNYFALVAPVGSEEEVFPIFEKEAYEVGRAFFGRVRKLSYNNSQRILLLGLGIELSKAYGIPNPNTRWLLAKVTLDRRREELGHYLPESNEIYLNGQHSDTESFLRAFRESLTFHGRGEPMLPGAQWEEKIGRELDAVAWAKSFKKATDLPLLVK